MRIERAKKCPLAAKAERIGLAEEGGVSAESKQRPVGLRRSRSETQKLRCGFLYFILHFTTVLYIRPELQLSVQLWSLINTCYRSLPNSDLTKLAQIILY
jgi:hypothetical protein